MKKLFLILLLIASNAFAGSLVTDPTYNSVTTDAVTSKTTNTDLALSGNGTGGVDVNDTLNVTESTSLGNAVTDDFTVNGQQWNVDGAATINGAKLGDDTVGDTAINWGSGAGQVGLEDLPGATLTVDTINEDTAGAGVTVEGVLIEDGEISTDSVINAEKYNAVGDGVFRPGNGTSTGCSINIAVDDDLLTCTGAPFLAGRDEGKAIFVSGAGPAGGDLITTISTVNSTSSVTLAAVASTTASYAKATFGTDNGTYIQNAINALPSKGGTVFLPAGTYVVTSTITLGNGSSSGWSTKYGQKLVGATASGTSTDPLNPYEARTTILSTAIVSMVSGPAIEISGPMSGWGLENISVWFATTSSSAIGIKETAGQKGHAKRITVLDPPSIGILTQGMPVTYTGYGAANSSANHWEDIDISLLTANAIGIKVTGGTATNSCFNTFENISVSTYYTSNKGIYLAATDNNRFIGVTLGPSYGGSAGKSITFDYTVNDTWPADTQFFSLMNGGFGAEMDMEVVGTPNATYASNNIIYSMGETNLHTKQALANVAYIGGGQNNKIDLMGDNVRLIADHVKLSDAKAATYYAEFAVPTLASDITLTTPSTSGTLATISDTAYGAGWDGDTSTAPSKNAVYDKIETVAGGGAPADATYITQTVNGTLSNEQALSSLSSGFVKVTNGTGVLTSDTNTYYKSGDSPTFTSLNLNQTVSSGYVLNVPGSLTTSSNYQYPIRLVPQLNLGAANLTSYGVLVSAGVDTSNGTVGGTSYNQTYFSGFEVSVVNDSNYTGTVATANAFTLSDGSDGGGAITNYVGLRINNLTAGATANIGILNAITSGAGKWGYYGSGGAASWHKGDFYFGGASDSSYLAKIAGADGTISAPAAELISSELADTSTPHTVTAIEASGTILNNYNASPSARVFNVPVNAKGLNFKFILGDANNVTLHPVENTQCTASTVPWACCTGSGTGSCTAEYMMLDGVLMAAGEAIVNTTTPAIGDAIVCNAFRVGASTYYWDCRTLSGDWAQETP